MKRVVITGMNAITPLGNSWEQVFHSLQCGVSGIRYMDEWADIRGLDSHLAAPSDPEVGQYIPIKVARTMSRVSLIAAETADKALTMSGLPVSLCYEPNNIGIAFGSSFGAHEQMVSFSRIVTERRVRGVSPTGYIQLMGHTTGVNLSLFLKLKGRLIPTSSACASGGQALGYAWETIRQGIHPVMLAGSAEELSPMQVAVFDSFYAASRENEHPESAARPFTADRKGLVVGEGGASFILEELEHAVARGADVYGEIVGFATNMDGCHVTKQDVDVMCRVMEQALASAGLRPDQIGYINAHAAGTSADAVEVQAIRAVFGEAVPVASSKGHIGHMLGGCGAAEAWLAINMMNQGWFAPTLNLDVAGSDCQGVNHIGTDGLHADCEYVMSNNFAFGGVNVSVIFRKYAQSNRSNE